MTVCWTLGWICLLTAKVVGSADAVTFHCHGQELDDGTGGKRQVDACHHHDCLWRPPGLSNNIHVHYFLVLFYDSKVSVNMPWWLVMPTCSVGLCSLPLWVVYLVCKYFKFVVWHLEWAFTCQVLFSLIFNLTCCIHHPCLLVIHARVLL